MNDIHVLVIQNSLKYIILWKKSISPKSNLMLYGDHIFQICTIAIYKLVWHESVHSLHDHFTIKSHRNHKNVIFFIPGTGICDKGVHVIQFLSCFSLLTNSSQLIREQHLSYCHYCQYQHTMVLD